MIAASPCAPMSVASDGAVPTGGPGLIEVFPRFDAFQARVPEHQIDLLRLTPFVY